MELILFLWIILGLIVIGFPSIYYKYMRHASHRPWNLKINKSFSPSISVLIPTHNEEEMIEFKLKNICKLIYPKSKMQVIVSDDASDDNTVKIVRKFIENHPKLKIDIIRSEKHLGKSSVLNLALKNAKYDVIVMTDADALLAPSILVEALPYLADPTIGAIIGQQKVLNSNLSLATKIEDFYLDLTYSTLRLGESKVHSSVIFHGSFEAYKKEFLKEFNTECDDSGTALDIIQTGARAIYVPEAICFDLSPTSFKTRFLIKIRRATQNVRIYAKCLKLLLKQQLHLPKKIIIPETFLYLINPILFIAFMFTTGISFFIFLPYSLVIPIIALLAFLNEKSRLIFIEAMQSNIILLCALFMVIFKKSFVAWSTNRGPEFMPTNALLLERGLI